MSGVSWTGRETQITLLRSVFPPDGEFSCWPVGGRHMLLLVSGSDWTPGLCSWAEHQ